jgi:hypothetical protein
MSLLKTTTGLVALNIVLTVAIIATGHLVSYLIGWV